MTLARTQYRLRIPWDAPAVLELPANGDVLRTIYQQQCSVGGSHSADDIVHQRLTGCLALVTGGTSANPSEGA